MDPLISVIVPVYRVEPFLDRCVQSITNQSYSNLEIILVDDGSPDGCPALCDAWQEKDSRIRVIHQENKGLSAARNAGMELAQGDFLAFVDSDDYIAETMLEALLAGVQTPDTDIVECGFFTLQNDRSYPFPLPDRSFDAPKAVEYFLHPDRQIKTMVWNKLYRRSTMGALRFREEIRHGEDLPFTYAAAKLARHYVQISDLGYYYCKHGASMTGESFQPQKLDALAVMEEITADVLLHYPQWKYLADFKTSLVAFSLLKKLMLCKSPSDAYASAYQKLLQINKTSDLKLLKAHFSRKAYLHRLLCRCWPSAFRLLYRLWNRK